MNGTRRTERVFKTAWFSRAARKAFIADEELCSAIRQVMLGQADDLGGGIYKKRLGRNQYRAIILARGGRTGYTSTCLRNKTAATSVTMNWLNSGRLLQPTQR
jgi:hypothetical protein